MFCMQLAGLYNVIGVHWENKEFKGLFICDCYSY